MITDIVRVERVIKAPPETVWRLWTTPELMRLWWGHSEQGELIECEMDVRPGGALRYAMRSRLNPDAPVERVTGTYEVTDAPRLLVFSWVWVGGSEPVDTQVTVRFEPTQDGTRISVLHERQPSERVAAIHTQGWTDMLSDLARAATIAEGASG